MSAFRSRTDQIDSIFVTTYRRAKKDIIDNIFNKYSSTLWNAMRHRGGMVPSDGGESIKFGVEKSTNDVTNWVVPGSTVEIADFHPLEQVRYDWKYATKQIIRFWIEDQQNSGPHAIANLVKTKIRNTIKTFAQNMETYFFGTGEGLDNQIASLQQLIANDGQGLTSKVVGGIDSSLAANAWWRNQQTNVGSGLAADTDAGWLAEGLTMMREMIQSCKDATDIIVMNQHMYNLYQDDMLQYFQTDFSRMKDLGLPTDTPTFMGRPIIWSDQIANSGADANMYFVDLDSLEFQYDPKHFLTLSDWIPIPSQVRDRVAHVTLACALTINNRSTNGVLHNCPNA